jgi:hypothetical protein
MSLLVPVCPVTVVGLLTANPDEGSAATTERDLWTTAVAVDEHPEIRRWPLVSGQPRARKGSGSAMRGRCDRS